MPVYCWVCPSCENQQSIFALIEDCKKAPICCDVPSERDYMSEHNGYFHKTVFPYVTKHLSGDGKPIEVRDAGHLRDLCKQYGKVLRDDVGFEHEEAYTNNRGRWSLKDNSRGEGGRWI